MVTVQGASNAKVSSSSPSWRVTTVQGTEAVTALSLPSLIMLRKAVKPKLLLTFTVIVTVGITFIGYLFNACSFMF